MSEAQDRQALSDYARRMHQSGWVANHDGNLSVRLGDKRFLATPTSTSKADVTPPSIVLVDDCGVVQGRGKVFSEIGLHLLVYRLRSDVHAVVHAHPPAATAFAVAGVALPEPFIAEALVSLGPSIPLVPSAAPGPAAVAALEKFVAEHDAVLLGNHGVLAWGKNTEQAFLRCELVEHLAKITLAAQPLGGPRPLPRPVVAAMMEARRKAGLGQAAERAQVPSGSVPASGPPSVIACAPAPPGATVTVRERPKLPPPGELAALIREELERTLRK